MAHGLTTLRLLLIAPVVLALASPARAAAWVAAGGLLLAIATDLLDGRVARARGTASPFGRAFDHAVDFAFVTSALCVLAWRGAVPRLLPALVTLAFAQYVVDSYWLRRARSLRMSSLGRWNGILYYAPPCADVLARLGFPFPGLASGRVLWLFGWALALSTLLSIVDRALALTRSRESPGSRDSRAA